MAAARGVFASAASPHAGRGAGRPSAIFARSARCLGAFLRIADDRHSRRAGRAYAYPAQAAPAAYASPQPKKRGWIVALVAVVLLFIVTIFGMMSCTNVLSGFSSLGSSLDDASSLVTTGPSVGVIEISGTIQYDGSVCCPEGLKGKLDEAAEDPNIKAIVCACGLRRRRRDSGGGDDAVREGLLEARCRLERVHERERCVRDIFSSGLHLHRQDSAIGAIGTAMQITDLSGLYEKLGINIEDITSAEGKDSSYGTRGLTDEERAHYQHMVDQINETFLQSVAEGRGMDIEEVRAWQRV